MTRALYLLLVVAVLAGGVLASRTNWAPVFVGSSAEEPPPADRTGLPGREVPTLDSPHIAYEGAPHAPYNSVPPTSGAHLPWAAPPGIYSSPVPDELAVHSLEHGHVDVLYASDTPAAQVAVLQALARERPRDIVLAPYPALSHGIALTAWGRIENLDAADRSAVLGFVDALAGRYNHGWVPKSRQALALAGGCTACACGCC
ncbi:DUF3105 domain-containing protein [Kutzneria sp. NPDC052558]|uniref:DUF3105 domain-containing protein n=1 Tax=Kutzneria sp. NPDC052558 TaxID=3364121 RepID=UPI0037CC6ED1